MENYDLFAKYEKNGKQRGVLIHKNSPRCGDESSSSFSGFVANAFIWSYKKWVRQAEVSSEVSPMGMSLALDIQASFVILGCLKSLEIQWIWRSGIVEIEYCKMTTEMDAASPVLLDKWLTTSVAASSLILWMLVFMCKASE